MRTYQDDNLENMTTNAKIWIYPVKERNKELGIN
jgi:hypothetical protein